MAAKDSISVYVFEYAPRKDVKPKNKRITKIGISNAPKRRFDEVTKDGNLQQGKILFSTVVPDAEKVEGQLHKKYARQNIKFQSAFSGQTEFFDLSSGEQKKVIDYLKSFTKGAYKDYEEINYIILLAFFSAPIVIYFLYLYLK